MQSAQKKIKKWGDGNFLWEVNEMIIVIKRLMEISVNSDFHCVSMT